MNPEWMIFQTHSCGPIHLILKTHEPEELYPVERPLKHYVAGDSK